MAQSGDNLNDDGHDVPDDVRPAAAGVSAATVLRLAFLSFSVVILGSAFGMQGAFPALEQRGFFSSQCLTNGPSSMSNGTARNHSLHHSRICPEQRRALSRVTFAAVAFVPACSFFSGVLVERTSGMIAFALAGCCGGVGWLVMLIDPASGIGFAVGLLLAAMGAAMSAMAALGRLVPQLLAATPDLLPIGQSLFTSSRILSVLVPVPLGYLLAAESIPLETTFVIMGGLQLLCAAVSVPVFWQPRSSVSLDTADDGPVLSIQSVDQPPLTQAKAAPSLGSVFRLLGRCVRRANWVFVGTMMTATATVTYISFAMSHIGEYAAARGESPHVADREFTLVLGFGGCLVGLVVGRLFGPLQQAVGGSHQRACATVSLGQTVLLTAVGVLVGIGSTGEAGLWVVYVVIVVFRMLGFTAVNIGWTMVVVENKLPGAGSSFSVIYTTAGVLALIVGLSLPAAVGTHHFVTLHWILVGICIALGSLGAVLAATQKVSAGNSGEERPILAE